MNIRVFTTWLCEILAFVVFDSDLSCFSLKKRSITDLFAEPASHCYVFPPALAALSEPGVGPSCPCFYTSSIYACIHKQFITSFCLV